uniref:Amine oxidase domain-containing protein n=1 Tax=Rhizophora mucronata TaxID=61149 RepID=A0A2P2PJY8_RHIMU
MSAATTKVAVVGSGMTGAICASKLARNGLSVTLFESARGPGGRMSQRRETCEDGTELLFDHGAPFFSVSNADVLSLVHEWELKGLVAEWKQNFGSFDCLSRKFLALEQEGLGKRYVGVPGMNSICRMLCSETGVDSKYGVEVTKLEWLDDENLWSLTGLAGQNIGLFKGVIATDKNIISARFTDVTGCPPPLDSSMVPELAVKLQDIPVNPCFVLMLAFAEPLSSIPVKGFSFKNSEILSWCYCNSSKPGRSTRSDLWVLHSTTKYARGIIAQTGLQKPSSEILTKVAEELFQEFQSTGLNISQPFFRKAHRWGSAFPAASIAGEEKCVWDKSKKLAICGDFCVSPSVEGSILSGLAAVSKLTGALLGM